MEQEAPAAQANGFDRLNEETIEGLSNLAHGLPHDQFDPQKGRWSGGGFPKFTGENANLIGASQLEPADGFTRSMMKMSDGSTGTVYQNKETGETHVVQFASVDNGVLQGTIRKIDPDTGKLGEDFAFKAVHSSVPGADTFSANAVAVREPSGGSYHLATGAETVAFSTADTPAQAMGSSYTPGGANRMEIISRSETVGKEPAGGFVAQTSLEDAEAIRHSSQAQPVVGVPPTQAPPSGMEAQRVSAPQNTIAGETPMRAVPSSEAPPVTAGMQPPQNQVRRFSKSNPANLEVFRRDNGQVEAFDKRGPDSEPNPSVAPPKK